VQSAYGKLPGVEFWASGIVSTDLASGAWQAVRQVRLQAKLRPAEILALCCKELPGRLIADGTTEINVTADGDQQHLTLSRLAIDATGNTLRQGQDLLKPAGTKLTLEADAMLDKKTWGLRSSACAAVIGDNRFCGNWAVGNVKQLCEQLAQPDILNDPRWPGRLFENLQCNATCELGDVECLRRLASGYSNQLAQALADVRVTGNLEGKLQLTGLPSAPGAAAGTGSPPQPHLRLELAAPAATAVSVGHAFAKPAGSPLILTAQATISPHQWALEDVLINLAKGDTFVRLLECQVQKLPQDQPQDPPWALRLTGRIDVDSAKPLMDLLPASSDFAAAIDGDIDGNCDLTFSPSSITSNIDLDFSQASVNVGDFFNKPLGQAASAKMSSQFTTGSGGCINCPLMKLSFDSPQATANVDASGTWAADAWTQFDANTHVRIKDCGWLFATSPRLTRATPDAKVSGAVDIAGALSLHEDRCEGSLNIQADATDVSATWPSQFRKQPGCPLALVVKGFAQLDAHKQAQLELTVAELNLAGCTVSASGKATLKPGDGRNLLLSSLERHEVASLDARMKASADFDEATAALSPQVGKTLAQFGISGQFLAQARMHADADELTFAAGVDADKLVVVGNSWLAKPADMSCQAQVELTAQRAGAGAMPPPLRGAGMFDHPDASVNNGLPPIPQDHYPFIHLNNLHMALGPVDVLASGDLDKEGWLAVFEQVSDFAAPAANPNPKTPVTRPQPPKERNKPQVAISLADASRLAAISPALAPYHLEGKAAMDLTYSITDGGAADISFHAGNLRAKFKGKDLAVNGPLAFGNIRMGTPLESQSATVRTDGLEFRIGDNHGWLIADLKDFPKAAASGHNPGKAIELVCENLDDKDLSDWLGGPPPQPQFPCLTQTQPMTHPCSNLPPRRADELRQEAARFLQSARPFLLAANLQARIAIAHLHDYDAAVGQAYDMNDVEITGSLNHGKAALTMLAGLDGGVVEIRREVDLGEERPRTTVMPAGVVTSQRAPSAPWGRPLGSVSNPAAAQTRPANPLVAYYTQYKGVMATPAFQPQLSMFFPGNSFNGEFSRTETVTVPLIEAIAKLRDGRFIAKPVGTANTVTTNGIVEGRGAPDFVTKIFPGLSITKYHYDKMTAFAQFNPDGTADNDMIFRGHPIDMYIEGTTDAANLAKYEIGILLGTPQTPDSNHNLRQGRIPLLKFKGIIENGKIYDEEVSFPWPNETPFTVFLKNNIFYRAWLDEQQKKK
jgi:hypothetical protein